MKQRYIFLIMFLSILQNANSQIPNSGFENWISYGNGGFAHLHSVRIAENRRLYAAELVGGHL